MSLATSFIAFLVAAGRAKPDPSALRISALEVENIRLRSAVSELRARLAAAQAPLEGPRGPSGPAMAAQTSDWPAEQMAQHQEVAMANPVGQWRDQQLGRLGAQNLALDAEYWRNCTLSRSSVWGGRGGLV
jgi:hypothetical protein